MSTQQRKNVHDFKIPGYDATRESDKKYSVKVSGSSECSFNLQNKSDLLQQKKQALRSGLPLSDIQRLWALFARR